MKNLKILSLFLLVIAMGFIACNDEESVSPVNNPTPATQINTEENPGRGDSDFDADCDALKLTVNGRATATVWAIASTISNFVWTIDGEEFEPFSPNIVFLRSLDLAPGEHTICFEGDVRGCERFAQCVDFEI